LLSRIDRESIEELHNHARHERDRLRPAVAEANPLFHAGVVCLPQEQQAAEDDAELYFLRLENSIVIG